MSEPDVEDLAGALASYTSIIRVRGKAILPPVITPEYRLELRKHKAAAIKKQQDLAFQKQRRQLSVTEQIYPQKNLSDENFIGDHLALTAQKSHLGSEQFSLDEASVLQIDNADLKSNISSLQFAEPAKKSECNFETVRLEQTQNKEIKHPDSSKLQANNVVEEETLQLSSTSFSIETDTSDLREYMSFSTNSTVSAKEESKPGVELAEPQLFENLKGSEEQSADESTTVGETLQEDQKECSISDIKPPNEIVNNSAVSTPNCLSAREVHLEDDEGQFAIKEDSNGQLTSPVNRSDSFTMDTPSLALSKRLASSAPPPGPDSEGSNVSSPSRDRFSLQFQLPFRTPPPRRRGSNLLNFENASDLFGISSSPVISQKLTDLVLSESGSQSLATDPQAAQDQLSRLDEMEKLLADYHKLQVEELRCRQDDERKRLLQQKEALRRVAAPPPRSPLSVADSQSNISTSSAKPRHRRLWGSKSPQRTNYRREVPEVLKKKLGAMIKGYLVRRLLATERLRTLKDTMRESREQLQTLSKDSDGGASDKRLNHMMHSQLELAMAEIQAIFFEWPSHQKMRLISRQRDIEAALRFRGGGKEWAWAPTQRRAATPSKRKRLSSATLKSLARKGELLGDHVRNEGVQFQSSSPRHRPHSSKSSVGLSLDGQVKRESFSRACKLKPWR